jgi:hypothetical protein
MSSPKAEGKDHKYHPAALRLKGWKDEIPTKEAEEWPVRKDTQRTGHGASRLEYNLK